MEENFFKLEYELDEMLEDIYENIILPYLEDYSRKEILQKLNPKNKLEFKNFFYNSSPYFKYINENLNQHKEIQE